uniref:Si:dkey-12h9.6 n=1 Tax=Myripristis murdjan TaxID=586833 RepID=A0A667XEM7_9TELE
MKRLLESAIAYTFLKFMIMWTLVLLADFVLEFRLEYLWPCWLFFGSVYTTFHCHGLVICVVFVCAAFTLDIFCLIFVPLHWLFFVASTYVLFNYIWHTEKGICISTVSLWILLVYTEASLRLKDLKNSHANLSHLFAAHCIGYPVVYLGFDATCYFTNIFKLRTQKAVQSENDFHMHLLQHSLPPGLQLYSKTATDGSGSEYNANCPPSTHSHLYSSHYLPRCFLVFFHESSVKKGAQEARSADSNRRSSSSKVGGGESRDHLYSAAAAGGAESPATTENLPQEEPGSKAARAAKSSSPKTRRTNTNTSSPSTGRTDKKQRSNSKTVSPNRDMTDKSSAANHSHHAEQMTKLEQELRRLKAELQASRQSEQELRSHICNLTNSERSLRPEVSLLRQSNMLLQSKILCLTKTKQRDKQTNAMLEKKTRAETEARLSVEKQLAELQAQKLEEAASTFFLCFWTQALGKYRCVEQETDMLLSTLSAMQEKAQHLEYNLSAETRIKLDLFSALGDARRQLEIAQGKVMKQDKEISEMKQKIAEVMAVSPGVSYMTPRPPVPQYLTKLLNSERYMLNPRALMYQCLKK